MAVLVSYKKYVDEHIKFKSCFCLICSYITNNDERKIMVAIIYAFNCLAFFLIIITTYVVLFYIFQRFRWT